MLKSTIQTQIFLIVQIRAGRWTKETKLLSKMIGGRELSEGKRLYRHATVADLNDLDTSNLSLLEGQIYNFSGFYEHNAYFRFGKQCCFGTRECFV